MSNVNRVLSSLVLATGIVLVFAGLSKAMGFTFAGVIASVGAIAALLYAGGAWFGSSPALAAGGAQKVIVFDRLLNVTAGAAPGTPLLLLFPEAFRAEIEARCRAALRGEHAHFACEQGGRRVDFDVSPVQPVAGLVLHGLLISGTAVPALVPAQRPLTTVA